MAKLNVFTLENLSLYDSLIKQYINAGDAKSLKSVSIDGRTLKFFKEENPAEGATPAFSITVPEQDLSALQAAIKANEDAIKAINNETTGILKTAKDYTDTQVNALAVGAVKDNADAIDALEDRADALEGRATDLEGRATAVEGRATALEGRADAVEATVAKLDGEANVAGSVKAQIAAAKTELEGKITNSMYNDTEVRGLISDNKTAVEKAQGEVDALEEKVDAMYTNEAIDIAVADAKKAGEDAQKDVDALEETVAGMYTNAQIDKMVADGDAAVKAIADANAEAIEAHKTAVDNKVTTLVGDDAGKSVRKIANEELAAQLLSGDADADFQTLQELAAWLEDHPEDVAAINLNIQNLQTLVGTIPADATATDIVGYIAEAVAAEKARAEEVEGDFEDRIAELEEAVGEGGSVDSQIDAKIADLDADVKSAEVETGRGIQVQVTEVDGVITKVYVTGDYNNKYDAIGSAEIKALDAEKAAKEHANGLNTAMDSRVTIVEGLVGEGYQAIPDSEINALFA